METFGDLLRRFRSAGGFSQAELAERTGLSVDGIGALERGARTAPNLKTLMLLKEALSLSDAAHLEFERAGERGRARFSSGGSAVSDANHNLPNYWTSFVGRIDEVDEIITLIVNNRLVTVTGSGGVGKTRTTVEAVSRLVVRDGVDARFVELAPLTGGDFLVSKVASILGIRLSGADDADALADALKRRHAFLIFDTCEHLTVTVTALARTLLQRCPNVRIVATSRERLGIIGECVRRVSPLALPDDSASKTVADARSHAALELFIERALWVDPDLSFTGEHIGSTIEICRRLEGIPLAIELAAARLTTMTVATLAARLKEDFAIARRTKRLPARQQTMYDTIAWSFNLLDDQERVLFRRLSVFLGGCTLAAAEAVCAGDDLREDMIAGCLASLVDKSLVDAVLIGERMRYVLLDSTRAFARERLAEVSEGDSISRRHAQWLARFGETALSEYLSVSNHVWLRTFRHEVDNVRTALEWALASSNDDALTAGQIAGRFRGLWVIPGYFHECRRWMKPALDRIDENDHPLVVVDLLKALSPTLVGTELLIVRERIGRILRQVGDGRGLIAHLASCALAYSQSGLHAKAEDCINEARSLLGEAQIEPYPDIALLVAACEIHASRRQFERARRCLDEAVSRSDGLDDNVTPIYLMASYAELDFNAGEPELAIKGYERAVVLAMQLTLSTTPLSYLLWRLACCLLSTSNVEGAAAAAERSLMLSSTKSDDEALHLSLHVLAAVMAVLGHARSVARIGGYVEAWSKSVSYWRNPIAQKPRMLLASTIRTQLSNDMFDALSNQGAKFTIDDALEEVQSAMRLDVPLPEES